MSSAALQTPPTATPEQDRLLNAMAWVELHRSTLLLGVVGLFVAFAAIFFWRHAAAERERRANGALLELHQRPGSETQPSAADFLKVAEQYPSTIVADRARLLAAGAFYTEGRYAEALTEFERVAAGADNPILSAQAAYGVAASLEAQGKLEPAVAKYQDVLSRYPRDSVAGQARLSLARIEEGRGQSAAALRLIDEVLRSDSAGPFAEAASNRRRLLLRNHPELAASSTTNTPALAAP